MCKVTFFLCAMFFGSLIAHQQSVLEQPTLEQLMDSDTIIVHYECKKIDKSKFDKEQWKTIVTKFNALIDLCYATEGKNDPAYQELYQAVEIARPKDDCNQPEGIISNLEIIITSEANLHKNHKVLELFMHRLFLEIQNTD